MPKENIDDANGSKTRTEVSWAPDAYVQIGVVNRKATVQEGQFMDLDRDGINRLIKALRRARDSAYGRDE